MRVDSKFLALTILIALCAESKQSKSSHNYLDTSTTMILILQNPTLQFKDSPTNFKKVDNLVPLFLVSVPDEGDQTENHDTAPWTFPDGK